MRGKGSRRFGFVEADVAQRGMRKAIGHGREFRQNSVAWTHSALDGLMKLDGLAKVVCLWNGISEV